MSEDPPKGSKKETGAKDSVDELVEKLGDTMNQETTRDQILRAHRRREGSERYRVERARERTEQGRAEREAAEEAGKQEQAAKLAKAVEEDLPAARKRLKESAFKRKAADEYVAARRERIEELRKESIEAMKTSAVGDRRRPRDYFEEIAAIEADIRDFEARRQEKVPSRAERKIDDEKRVLEAEESGDANEPPVPSLEEIPAAEPIAASENGESEPALVVPDKKTESVRAGIHATDPVESPETPKEMRASLAEAARILQSGEGYIDSEELMRKSRGARQAGPLSPEDAARIYQSGGEGYMDSMPKAVGPHALSPEEQEALAKQFSSEEAARTYQTGVLSGEEIAAPAIEIAPAEQKQEPQTAREDDGPIVMVNPVLNSIALGKPFRRGKSESGKKGAKKGKPRRTIIGYTATDFGTSAAGAEALAASRADGQAVAPESKKRTAKKAGVIAGLTGFFWGSRKRKLATAGGVGAGILGAALLSLIPGGGKKEDAPTAPKQPDRPAAGRSAEEAGVKPPTDTVAVPKPATKTPSAAKPEVAKASPAAKKKPEMKASARVEQSWDVPFNNWEKGVKGHARWQSDPTVIKRMAAETNYPLPWEVNTYEAPSVREAPAPAPTAPEQPATPPAPMAAPERQAPQGPVALESTVGRTPALYEYKGGLAVFGGTSVADRVALAETYVKENPQAVVRFFSMGADNRVQVNEVFTLNGVITARFTDAANAGIEIPKPTDTARPLAQGR